MLNNGGLLFIGNFLPAPRHNKNVWHFLAEKLAETGWSVITTSNEEHQLLRLVDMLLTIWRERRSYQVAHIDVFSGKAFIFAQLSTILLKWLKKPIILTLHGGGLPEFADKHHDSVNKVLMCADAVVTPSAYLQADFIQIRPDIILIPNPINTAEAIYRERKEAAPRLIWVRAFHQIYNPSMAVRVLYELQNEFPQIHLYMLGPDKGDGSLEEVLMLSDELGVRSKLQVLGHVPHDKVSHWLNMADIFINTSNYDNAPSSLLEAMANGLCVVTTNVGGIPSMASDGVEAMLVEPKDFQAMASAITKILRDPSFANHLSANARRKAEQYNWTVILPQWERLLSSVISQDS
ncbi:MAG: glycosyltransferase family 4 protein [Anaerolineaceae bacterium]|jgi:glycosyltransferase involved in cell wall biosynthesis